MFRKHPGFHWRGGEVTRLVGFTDAVFALLATVWYQHYRFFRRYALENPWAVLLTRASLSDQLARAARAIIR
jgi:uncharacterized membrane protein